MATIAEQLTNLEQLKAANLISEEEYKAKREQVLASFAENAHSKPGTGGAENLPTLEKSAHIIKPAKSKRTALILEVLLGAFGLYGIGWLYGSNIKVGAALLIGSLVWIIIALLLAIMSVGISSLITFPIQVFIISLSSFRLNKYAKSHPELFKD